MKASYSFLSDKVIVLSFLLWFSMIIMAESHASIPLITDDTDTQGSGKFQIEALGEYSKDKQNAVENKTNKINASLACGVVDPVDNIVSSPYQFWNTDGKGFRETEKGISDLSLEVKWRFFEKECLAFALKPGLTLPIGNERKGLGSGKAAYYINLIESREVNPWSFDVNVGYARNENEIDEKKNLWSFTLAAKLEIKTGLKFVGETDIESNHSRLSTVPPVWICSGFIYCLADNFDICLGVK